MNFKAYDILSSLVPGFLTLLLFLKAFNMQFDNNMVIAYTAFAFLLGYLTNTISSWLEELYFLTWKGKPSERLLMGKDIWKVKYYDASKTKALLQTDSGKSTACNDELFSIAINKCNGKDSKIDDFNAAYAFSRNILTTVLIGTIILLVKNPTSWQHYVVLIPSLIIVWLRCKQKAYYYAREVLNIYLKVKAA